MAKQKINFTRVFGFAAVLTAIGAMHYPLLNPAPQPMVYAGGYGPHMYGPHIAGDCMTGMDGKAVKNDDIVVDGEVAPKAI